MLLACNHKHFSQLLLILTELLRVFPQYLQHNITLPILNHCGTSDTTSHSGSTKFHIGSWKPYLQAREVQLSVCEQGAEENIWT
jgi:hypothetical protein